jgi:D-alanine-D-alanine ligase
MQRTKILLLFGGESSEHDVSISSARNVFAAINEYKFEVILGYIDPAGKWWLLDNFDEDVSTHRAAQLVPVLGRRSFATLPASHLITPDVILPILHGKNGEDGSIAALGQLLHIPVVGCDMTASAVSMDKRLTKQVLMSYELPVVPYATHRQDEPVDFNRLSMTLGSPLFVKPARSGSSVGVSKVYTEEELLQALDVAHQHDEVALIERAVSAREIELAVLGSYPDFKVSTPGEIKVFDDFYSYEAKYTNIGASEVQIPADITEVQRGTLQDLVRRTYGVLGCAGLARIDFFLLEDGTIYINEVNTLPGFTNISMYPKLWQSDGIKYPELIEALIADAILKTQNHTEEHS